MVKESIANLIYAPGRQNFRQLMASQGQQNLPTIIILNSEDC